MKAQAHEYDGGGVASRGYLALPDQQGKRPGILVVHEAPGLDTHPKRRAEMLAELGYVALAADLYGQGIVGNGPEEAFALMGPLRDDPDILRGRVRAGLNALSAVPAVEQTQLGAIGFCFGGMSVLELARSGASLAGVVAFHGLLETKRAALQGEIKGKVLVCTGGADPLVPAEQVDRFRKEMVEAGVDLQIIIYGDAKHSFTNTAAEQRTLPGRELQERVLRIAGGFETLGLVEGDVIAILMRNDFPFVEMTLAASMAGISAVPINWHSKSDEIRYILADAAPKAIFAHADLVAGIRDCLSSSCIVLSVEVPPEIRNAYNVDRNYEPASRDLNYAEWVAQSRAFKGGPRAVAPYISYTSGTTGKPKAVVREVPPPAVAQSIDDRGRAAHGLDILPIRAVLPGPLYHSAPNFHALNCVRSGELLILQPRFNPGELLDIVEQHRISHIHMVPTMFSRLLNLPESRRMSFDGSSLKAVVHGAAICPIEVKRKMIDWWGAVFREYYAATEVGVITAATSEDWLRYPGTVGRPPQGVEVAIHDENGRRLDAKEVGEIFFRLEAGAFVHYRNRPDATAELKRGEWLSLGDLGYVNEEGLLWITDRKKDMVISGGVNIFPAEIEDVLISHPSVEDCAVFGIPDDDLGEILVAVLKPRGKTPSTRELTGFCKERLGTLKTPRAFTFVEHLPREDTGKLAKRRLKAAFLESAGSA